MSNWFCSVPHAFDGIAAATKVFSFLTFTTLRSITWFQFQQESMASLIRFYKQKCNERGALINRLKGEAAENKALKR